MRLLSILVLALFGTSCVPPSCLVAGFCPMVRPTEHLATIMVYAEPLEGPLKRRYEAGVGMWERFERSSTIRIDGNGRMMVLSMSSWPRRCPRAAEEHLADVAQAWQVVLDSLDRAHTSFSAMANPYTGDDDWRPDGPFLSLSYGSPSRKTFDVAWDGRRDLPAPLDTAVIGTLELACSSSRLAKRYLLRDLPPPVARRLDCSEDLAE